jgi:hypothetical protein
MNQGAVVYNKMYVHYDDEGNVQYISNVIDDSKRIFEIDINLVQDFLDLKKHAFNYKIDYFLNLSNGIVEEQKVNNVFSNFSYIVPKSADFNNEITLVHNTLSNSWTIVARDDIKYKLEVMSKITFFIVKKDDPYKLISFFNIDAPTLMKSDIIVDFTNEVESNLNLFSVVVEKKFNSYGIKEKNV